MGDKGVKKDLNKLFKWFEENSAVKPQSEGEAKEEKKGVAREFWRKVMYWLFLIGFAIVIYNTFFPSR